MEGYNNAPFSIFGGFERALRWLSEERFEVSELMTTVSLKEPATVYSDINARKITEPFIAYDWRQI